MTKVKAKTYAGTSVLALFASSFIRLLYSVLNDLHLRATEDQLHLLVKL